MPHKKNHHDANNHDANNHDTNNHDTNSYNANSHENKNANNLATAAPHAASRWLKNISAFGVTTVLSAGILVACGQMSSAENNVSSSTSKQNSGVKSSRDMLPSDAAEGDIIAADEHGNITIQKEATDAWRLSLRQRLKLLSDEIESD